MEHFYKNIEGYFTFPKLYADMVKLCPDGGTIVEIGAWYGCSTACMAVEIINSGKKINFFAVDTWRGSAEHKTIKEVQDDVLMQKFFENTYKVLGVINPLRITSVQAAKCFEDKSIDYCMIDASHDYDNVKADILAWLPKIKSGGYASGHDYNQTWPGVMKAVNELIPKVDLQYVSEQCWLYKIPQE